jgi:hypothetical protein
MKIFCLGNLCCSFSTITICFYNLDLVSKWKFEMQFITCLEWTQYSEWKSKGFCIIVVNYRAMANLIQYLHHTSYFGSGLLCNQVHPSTHFSVYSKVFFNFSFIIEYFDSCFLKVYFDVIYFVFLLKRSGIFIFKQWLTISYPLDEFYFTIFIYNFEMFDFNAEFYFWS